MNVLAMAHRPFLPNAGQCVSLILFEPFQAEIAAHSREHCQLGRVVEHRRESVFFME